MISPKWRKVAELSDLEEGVPKVVTLDEQEILLFKKDEKIYAYGNNCTHYGGPLNEGYVSGQEVTCPWHNARFNLKNGKLNAPPALDDLPHYQVRLEDDDVLIGEQQIQEIPKPGKIEESTPFLIIGAGAAGNAAAETLRREGFSGRITMITAEQDGPYDRTNLSKDFLAGKAEPEWIPLRSMAFYQDHGIDLVFNKRVIDLNAEKKIVTTENDEQFPYDKCLLATGGIPKKLTVPGSDLKNIFFLRSYQDAKHIDAAIKDAENVLIVGAGFIGLEIASSLRERGILADIVAPEKIPLAGLFGHDVGLFFQKLHEENGIKFHLGKTIAGFKGDSSVKQAVLSDKSMLECDLVIIGIGINPAVSFLQNTGILGDGAVPVNAQLKTKIDSIYAAGDIAMVPNPFTNESNRIEHWVVAERQGRHAAKSMLGDKNSYREIPFFWTQQYDRSFKYVGYGGKFDSIVARGNFDEKKFLTGYFFKDQFKAAGTMEMDKEFFALENILALGKKLTPGQFQDQHFDFYSLL